MPWPTELHRLVSEEVDDNWSSVVERCRSNPGEVGVQGAGYGQTALHVACYRYPPLGAVRAFLEACPDAALLQNSDGETALHLASDGASEEVQTLLLRKRPAAASMRDRYGDTPLHLAAGGGASPELLRAMIDADPTAASVPNAKGETALHLLGREYEQARSVEDVRRPPPRDRFSAVGDGTGEGTGTGTRARTGTGGGGKYADE